MKLISACLLGVKCRGGGKDVLAKRQLFKNLQWGIFWKIIMARDSIFGICFCYGSDRIGKSNLDKKLKTVCAIFRLFLDIIHNNSGSFWQFN